ncbi:MAG: hypothetical protein JO202_03005 [Ktedonobacteraceae bacterium]|nr:hypothetical protein [Ktedonobacteraceae bacterium]
MVQATQTKQAIGELLLAGTIADADFAGFLQTYSSIIPPSTSPDSPTLMLLEAQPRHVIAQEERQGLLHFALFDPRFNFAPYTSGRIFHALGELRWERQHSNIQIVYTGHKAYKPQLQDVKETELDGYAFEDRKYFLFGKRLDQEQLKRIGPRAQAGDFAEVRIPRLLRYPPLPTLANAERVQLVMCEYIDSTTALNVAYRFKRLVPFHNQSKTIGAQ